MVKNHKELDSLLTDIKAKPAKDLLVFYEGLGNYFIDSKLNELDLFIKEGLFPPSSKDYLFKEEKNYKFIDMNDSFQLFYMKGVYSTRPSDTHPVYFGVKINNSVKPVAYINIGSNNKCKINLNYNLLKVLNKKTLSKLLIATGFKLAQYKRDFKCE